MNERLYSTEDISLKLDVSRLTILKWLKLGKLFAIKKRIGNRIFLKYTQEELDRVKGLMKKKREVGRPLMETPK